jgi:Fe(3+) dicitrate transport protein
VDPKRRPLRLRREGSTGSTQVAERRHYGVPNAHSIDRALDENHFQEALDVGSPSLKLAVANADNFYRHLAHPAKEHILAMHFITRNINPISRIAGTVAIALPCFLSAQQTTGTVRGRITTRQAPSSAVIGLPVALEGTASSTRTDSAGRFVLAEVPAAHYTLVLTTPNGVVRHPVNVAANRISDVVLSLDSVGPAQPPRLKEVIVSAARGLHVIAHLPAVQDNAIFSGKKTEVIVMDSLHANRAQDIERQILGRVPGAHFSETEAAGFPSNGVGFRGLNPTQSVEMNTRQNGVNIAADVYGYPETYYTPPAEALDRIEVVRGAGSLAFGPQFGGVINYVVREGAEHSKPVITAEQTTGSFGLVNSFNAIGGGGGPWTYYGFLHFRGEDGGRPNSDFRQLTGYASAKFRASPRLTIGLEATVLRNRIHMPGGLSDAQFAADPGQSLRARNWLASPWNLTALRVDYDLAPRARLETVVSYLASDRHLVWRNEDGGPEAIDAVDPTTGSFVAREVERETFHNWTTESRLRLDHGVFGRSATLAVGVRGGLDHMRRFEGGPGSTGSDFDMNLYGGTWERALRFATTNAAVFAEELVRVTDRLSFTPGVRYEYLRSTADGYTDVDSAFAPRTFSYPLAGVGAEYATSGSTALYANATQAYRPILYASLTPFGSITRTDPALRTARGYNADFGWRGTIRNALKFDVDVFYLSYRDRVGLRTGADEGGTFTETTNVGTSVHKGTEVYLELDPLPRAARVIGTLDLFTSFAYIDARYVTGEFRGNRVEQAPRVVDRTGATYALGPFAATIQASYTAASFGDANNSRTPTDDAEAGIVPAYTVWDWSTTLRVARRYVLSLGINNLTDRHYFTKRTGEYPGPGILPGIARSVYAGVRATF